MDTADMEFVTDWPNNLDARSRRLLKALEKHNPDKYGAVQAIVAARYDALHAKGAR
jgi:hypothetical protein